MRLIHDPTPLTMVRIPPDHPVPAWAEGGRFSSITRTPEELSIVCESRLVPVEVDQSGHWVRFEVEGPLPFSLVGVLAALGKPLAEAGVSLFPIATYDTDHLLIRSSDELIAHNALTTAGHELVTAKPPADR